MKMTLIWVDEIMVFGDYIQKYARYGSEPKSENGENTSVYATMWDGVLGVGYRVPRGLPNSPELRPQGKRLQENA